MTLDLSHHDAPGTITHAVLERLRSAPETVSPRGFVTALALATHAQVEATDSLCRPVWAGECAAWVSAETLALETGVSRRTVVRGLKEIISVGIVIRRRAHHESVYIFPSIDTTGHAPSPFPQTEPTPPAPNASEMAPYYKRIHDWMCSNQYALA